MATITLVINVPDAQIPRVQAAARATFGPVDDGAGGLRPMTNAEITERFRQEFVTMIKGIVRSSERAAAIAAAEALEPVVDAT